MAQHPMASVYAGAYPTQPKSLFNTSNPSRNQILYVSEKVMQEAVDSLLPYRKDKGGFEEFLATVRLLTQTRLQRIAESLAFTTYQFQVHVEADYSTGDMTVQADIMIGVEAVRVILNASGVVWPPASTEPVVAEEEDDDWDPWPLGPPEDED